MSVITLYRVLFTEVTINGNITISTKWYEGEYECDKWLTKLDAKIQKREILKDPNAIKNAIRAKFSNN